MTGMWKKAVQAIPGWLKKYRYAGLVLLLGGLLLMWPAGGLSSGRTASPETSGQAAFDLESLERQMEQALSEIEGVGKVTVVLTLQSDGRVQAKPGAGFYTKLDLGIVKCHFELGSGKDGSIWA